MSIRTIYLRAEKYLQRHGLKSSLKRLLREVRNKVRYDREILFWRDLLREEFNNQALPENFRVEKYDKSTGVPERLVKRIAEEYSEELLQKYIRNRFEIGASLWNLCTDTEDISYTWTLTGRAMKPHYFPLLKVDLHMFDGFTFPSFRGRGLNAVLLNYVLKHYKSEGIHRAYLETKEWNTSVVKLMPKSGFVRIGLAKKRFRRGKCKVTWWL